MGQVTPLRDAAGPGNNTSYSRGSSEEQETNNRSELSAIILAGGESKRMGSDKAFLLHEGRPFVASIASEMLKVSDDVLVMIGRKPREEFEAALSREIKVLNDDKYIENPVGGVLSAFAHARHAHAAVVACDSPLVKADVIEYLFQALQGHSAAVPLWEAENKLTMEPLCAVYNVAEAKRAIVQVVREGRMTPKHIVLLLEDVLYVDVSQLRLVDPSLDSLVNVNTRGDYTALEEREDSSTTNYPGPREGREESP